MKNGLPLSLSPGLRFTMADFGPLGKALFGLYYYLCNCRNNEHILLQTNQEYPTEINI